MASICFGLHCILAVLKAKARSTGPHLGIPLPSIFLLWHDRVRRRRRMVRRGASSDSYAHMDSVAIGSCVTLAGDRHEVPQ